MRGSWLATKKREFLDPREDPGRARGLHGPASIVRNPTLLAPRLGTVQSLNRRGLGPSPPNPGSIHVLSPTTNRPSFTT